MYTEISIRPINANFVIKSCVIFHNILNRRNKFIYLSPGLLDAEDGVYNVIPGQWREENNWVDVRRAGTRNARTQVKNTRDKLKNFFLSQQGSVQMITLLGEKTSTTHVKTFNET